MRGEFVDVSGARLYYYAAGTRGAGEPVVLLHGFATSGHLWSDVIPLLPPGHRIVVLDLLGYGRSDRPQSRPVDIGGHAKRVLELLDVLGVSRACLVGHGLGGGIAQWLAVNCPDRVSRICLVNSVAFAGWPTMNVKLAHLLAPVAGLMPPATLQSILRRSLLRGYADADRAARSVDYYVRPFANPDGRTALMEHIAALNSRQTTELAPLLGEITAPTAVMWGQHDPFLATSLGRRLHQSIPRSTFDVIPGTRHFTPEEAPRQIADVVAKLLRR